MIGGLFTTLFGGGGGAAATAGAATTAAAGSSTLTLLQGAGTVFSALTTLGSGAAAIAAGETEKNQQQFESKNEFIAGRETSAALKAELAKTIGNQAVAFAAGGVDLGSVSVQQAKAQASSDAEKELSSASNDALTRTMQRQRAGRMAAARGRANGITNLFQAGNTAANFGADLFARG